MAEQELKVLLLEDNPGDAFLMKFYLGESTSPVFQVSHAETLKAALDFLAENKFDLILSDMNLPDSFGVDTIKSILGKFPGNLVIVLTGLTDESVGLETVRYGAQDFLVKGKFDAQVLISSVMFAFERFKLNRQIANVSKQLDEENTRFDKIQNLLSSAYFEFDKSSNSFFYSGFTEIFSAKKVTFLEDIFSTSEYPEKIKGVFYDVLANDGKGELSYKSFDGKNQFKLNYESVGGKFYGTIQKI